jgi:hypothetical protein
VIAWLLGFSGVWIDMEDGPYRAVTRHDLLPPMLAIADAGRAVLARYLYEELMVSVAGTVAEERIAGYRVGYVETDIAGRTTIGWDAIRAARIEAGLPICGHKDCEIPLDAGDAGVDAGRVTGEDVAEVIKRAEDEVFAMLQANWPAVQRVVNALCRRDRITSIEFDDLITGKRRRPKRKQATRHGAADTSRGLASATAASGKHGPSNDGSSSDGSNVHEPSMSEPTLIGDAA